MTTDHRLASNVMTLTPAMEYALTLLLRAHNHGEQTGRDFWDFALEIQTLEKVGCISADLRWLVCNHLVEHARELYQPGQNDRVFQKEGLLTFCDRTCFIPTEDGVQLARKLNAPAGNGTWNQTSAERPSERSSGVPAAAPAWRGEARELWVDSRMVKRFHGTTTNQEVILAAFSELRWPGQMDDPLPIKRGIPRRARLHDAINRLNRHQRVCVLRFRSIGGRRICWEWRTDCHLVAQPLPPVPPGDSGFLLDGRQTPG